jgi:hypothetical protein
MVQERGGKLAMVQAVCVVPAMALNAPLAQATSNAKGYDTGKQCPGGPNACGLKLEALAMQSRTTASVSRWPPARMGAVQNRAWSVKWQLL